MASMQRLCWTAATSAKGRKIENPLRCILPAAQDILQSGFREVASRDSPRRSAGMEGRAGGHGEEREEKGGGGEKETHARSRACGDIWECVPSVSLISSVLGLECSKCRQGRES